MSLFKEFLEKRKARKEQEQEIYGKAYERALEAKEKKRIEQEAYRRVGYIPSKKKKGKKGKGKVLRKRKTRLLAPRESPGYLDVGRSVPQLRREESFASLMGEHGGISLADFSQPGRGIMDFEEKKKKKKGFSLADW